MGGNAPAGLTYGAPSGLGDGALLGLGGAIFVRPNFLVGLML